MASNTCNMTIRLDKDLKEQGAELFKSLGLSFNAAITLFIQQALNDDGLPFRPRRTTPNKETLEAFKEAEEMLKDPSKLKTYTVEEAFKELSK